MAMPENKLESVKNNVVSIAQGLTPAQIELVKRTVAKGATDDELQMFLHLANKYGLDPFAKEIWFIKRVKKQQNGKDGKWDYPRLPSGEIDYSDAETTMMTSRDGYLKIAQSHPDYEGLISFPVREGDTFEIDANNYAVTHKFGAKRGKLMGAWAKCDRAGYKPQITFVEMDEYNDDKSNTWKKYPSAMIQKVAETFVLKRQFSVSGLVSQEEINSAFGPDTINDTPQVEQKRVSELPQNVGDFTVNLKGNFTKLSDMTTEQVSWLSKNAKDDQVRAMAQAYLEETEQQKNDNDNSHVGEQPTGAALFGGEAL